VSDKKVSIIIPTYNRAHLLGETLDSIISQTYSKWECIIVDDGSSDYTNELMEFYCEKDSRIQYYHRPQERPKGANACRNYGFELSKGLFIQWLDSDDLLAPDKLEVQLKRIEGEDELVIATCKFGYLFTSFQQKNVRKNVATYTDLRNGRDLLNLFGNYNEYFPAHVFLTSRKLISQANLWDEKLLVNQDAEFFTRILNLKVSIKFCDTYVYYRMAAQDNISLINSINKGQEMINSWILINDHLKDIGHSNEHPYVKQAKRNLYKKLGNDFPTLINENYHFFQSIIPFHKRILKSLF